MRVGAIGGVLLAGLTTLIAAGAAGAAPLSTAPDGAFAVAAPGYDTPPSSSGIFLSDGAVLWEDGDTGVQLTAIRRAAPSGETASFGGRPGSRMLSSGFAAADGYAVLLRSVTVRRPGCRIRPRPTGSPSANTGPGLISEPRTNCSLFKEGLLAGPARGPLRRLLGATRVIRNRFGCRRGKAFLADRVGLDPALSTSGGRVVYQERLSCPRQWRKSHYQLVLHDIRSDRRRVVHRGAVDHAQLAGRFLMYQPPLGDPRLPSPGLGREPSSRIVVSDVRTGKVLYRTPREPFGRQLAWPSLDSDGTLAGGYPVGELPLDLDLGWYSPAQPTFQRVGARAAISRDAPLLLADGRIAFLRTVGETGTEVAVADLAGHVQTFASFGENEEVAELAFDGRNVAWTLLRYRPYRGRRDDGLDYVCGYPGPQVLAQAPVIEVHRADKPGRIPPAQLPRAAAQRDRQLGGPSCGD